MLPSQLFHEIVSRLFAAQSLSVQGLKNFTKRFVIRPVILLLLLAEVADHLASAAHLQVADLVGDRTHAEPISSVSFLGK